MSSKEPPPGSVDTRTDVRSRHVTRTVHVLYATCAVSIIHDMCIYFICMYIYIHHGPWPVNGVC